MPWNPEHYSIGDKMKKFETRKEKMNHMFALMNEVSILISRLQPEDTGYLHTTIETLNGRVDELKYELEKEKCE